MPVDSLVPADYNPRKIKGQNLRRLRASLERFGQVQEVVVNKRSGRIVGGHQRVKAMVAAGIRDAAVVVVDLSDAEERALNVELNAKTSQGEFTSELDALLAEIERDLPVEFDALGFEDLQRTNEGDRPIKEWTMDLQEADTTLIVVIPCFREADVLRLLAEVCPEAKVAHG